MNVCSVHPMGRQSIQDNWSLEITYSQDTENSVENLGQDVYLQRHVGTQLLNQQATKRR